MRHHAFIGGLFIAGVTNLILLVCYMPPLMILFGDILLFGLLSCATVSRVEFYIPSFLVAAMLCLLVGGLLVYPRILAFEAETPEEHFIAAKSLTAEWRMPFTDPGAAWPHLLAAARGGIPEAECEVGMTYLYCYDGVVPFNRDEARRWLKAASAQGFIYAQRQLSDVDTVPATN